MKRYFVTAGTLLCLLTSTVAFAQTTNATVSGTIQDMSAAVLPGVTVTATNNSTGVVTTVVSNEAGAYTFPSLLPGAYKVTAELPGFQTKTYEVQLGNAQTVRLNFSLGVAGVGTAVEVTVAVDTLLATSSASVGEVLTQQKAQDLPLVGNNVLSLLTVMSGARLDDNGVTGTFAGMSNYNVNVQRDGIDASASARYMQAGIQTATMMNPDLIGEVRLIVAPVDAEMGRGNGQMIVQTRSGSNQLRGAAVWSFRNSALDANTWSNNRQTDSTGAWNPVPLDWSNRHQYTMSVGGPIVKNKTFFFALWDGLINNKRTIQNVQVLTPCARNGIFRYFDGWNNGNAIQNISYGGTPTIAVVDAGGNPLTPTRNPTSPSDNSAYTGTLHYASVFGALPSTLPPANADCSNIAALVQPGTNWDPFRKAVDPTGFVTKLLGKIPTPNNYELGDGLNTAGLRWVRRERGGNENLFGFADTGLFGGIDRKQINTKIDHNFNATNKVGVAYTYERDDGLANLAMLPDTFGGSTYRRPQQLAVNFVSTLSPSLVNEFRFGIRKTSGNTFNALYDPQVADAAKAFYPNINSIPVWVGLGQAPPPGQISQINFQTVQPLGSGTTSSYQDRTKMFTYGDSLSWTKGKHAFKAGGEMRRQNSWAKDTGVGTTAVPRALGGDAPSAQISTPAISTTNMPGLTGAPTSGNNQRMRQLLSFLSGSLSSITQAYYMQNPTKLDAFEDYRTFPSRIRDYHENEFSFFFKDDWKVLDNLTLNLGLRYDFYGSPYEANGLMPLPVGGGYSIFGLSGRTFSDWMKPGVRGDLTTLQFVGKNSPNPSIPWYPNDWNNFGPAVGFAWQVPWFGAGKTTVRGGYQVTYQIGESFNNLFQEQNVPGSIFNATYFGDSTNTYLDLTKLPSVIPLPVVTKPMQTIPVTDRLQSLYVPDPALVVPYAQNLTLAVTRSITQNLTLDLRYVGTLARKQRSAQNDINIPNFLYNGLKDALDAVRAGGESQLLTDMLTGMNIGGSNFGPVGSSPANTAGAELRASTLSATGVTGTLQSNLANGNYVAVARILNLANYQASLNSGLPLIPAGENGAILRFTKKFPENFIVTNPQFAAINWISNNASNNYHSLNAQVTMRPTRGVTWQSTYTWSKNLGVNAIIGLLGASFTNPTDRSKDYTLMPDSRTHDFRTNGTFALPIGPGQKLLANSTGILARIVEGWQTSWIVNLNTGQPLSISAQNMLYNNGTPDIVGPFDLNSARAEFPGGPNGSYFSRDAIKQVRDPQCLTIAQNLQNLCTLSAIADVKTNEILLQNPLPGTRGTLGQRILEGPGRWRFDASLAKSIKISETKSLQFRMDAQNVFNHPEPQTVITGTSLLNLDINNTNFGLFTGSQAKTNSHREFQAQLRLNF
jgi:Carboxypeptidase regulatory-like domain